MAKMNGTIVEISEIAGELILQVALEKELFPLPGQYFSIRPDDPCAVLPASAYPVSAHGQVLSLLPDKAEQWHSGQGISLRGPLGNGFSLPASAGRVGLIGLAQKQALCLLPLARTLLDAGKEVALVSDAVLQGLPMDLEILPGEQVIEVCAWAEAAAFAVRREEIAALLSRFRFESIRKTIEVMVMTEMPCSGISACGVCAVPTKKGWKHACKEGPVFALNELVEE
jgi:NAD(P)H-flavin reductase